MTQRLSRPRVAIASVGLGRIQRGFERACNDIFMAVRHDLDVTLYKTAGPQNAKEKQPALFGPIMAASRLLPLGLVAGGAEYRYYKNDCLAVGIGLLPNLLRGRFDVVYTFDYPLAKALVRLRQVFGFQARLLFGDGGLMPPQFYPRVDHIHQVGLEHFRHALTFGIPESHMTLVPCGFQAARFAAPRDRKELRRKYGIADQTKVIMVISAVKRVQKRVDYIIDEVSRVDGDILLWVDGKPEDPGLVEMAQQKLGARFRVTHVPSVEVTDLYHLADVFVHGALEEGFGLAIVEAAAAGLMLLVHDSPHFEWLLGSRDCLVDMSQPGNLARRLKDFLRSKGRAPAGLASRVHDRFDWSVLTESYVEMLRQVAALQPSTRKSA